MTDSKANKASKAKQNKAKSKASLLANTENAGGEVDKSIDHKINLTQAIALRSKGYTYKDIADKMGVSKQAVHQKLQHISKYLEPDVVQQWDKSKPAVLSVAEQVLIDDILDPAKRAKASLNNVAYAYSQLARERSLSLGRSTDNLGVAMLLQDSQQARDEAAELRKALLEEQE